MGNTNNVERNVKKRNNNGSVVVHRVKEKPPGLTDEQKKLLRNVWHGLKEDIEKVGVITFMRLFETHPEVHDAFLPFRSLSMSDMEQSAILRSHALRVMAMVDKGISRLDNPEKFFIVMEELGTRHTNYNATEEYIDLMGEQFIHALKPHLTDQWSEAHEKAFSDLFHIMAYYMKRGMEKREDNVKRFS
ncbi:hypothetical protein ACJMK2_007153 [Sinanodonta woodiana]|uniref:Globin domain-containing protein n=1 Tax=Sinanodonta woodiana TaxID=1069815 RepID=A0ABD3VKL0_SINWO